MWTCADDKLLCLSEKVKGRMERNCVKSDRNELNLTSLVLYTSWNELNWTERPVCLLCTLRAMQLNWTELRLLFSSVKFISVTCRWNADVKNNGNIEGNAEQWEYKN